jgi:hypothetical protein
MATTTNYGWTTPDNTSYVKDGASAIRTLGSSVDSSLYNKIYGVNRVLAADNTYSNQTTFADMSNGADKTALDLSVVKKQTSSLLLVTISMPVRFTSGASQMMNCAVNIAGTDYTISSFAYLVAPSQAILTGSRIITGISAATLACKPRFAAAGASAVTLPSGSIVSYTVQELAQ